MIIHAHRCILPAQNSIQITEIGCGVYYSMIMDCNGNVWMFGDNTLGVIGDGSMGGFVDEPKRLMIEGSGDIKAEKITCGHYHCHIRCAGNKHYLWGDNQYNQCLVYGDGVRHVRRPFAVDLKDKVIRNVFLGNDNTIIIVQQS